MSITPTNHRPTRRAVSRSLAWTSPVAVVGSIAPQASASGPPVIIAQASSAVCKLTGNGGVKVYRFTLAFANQGSTATTVCITAGTMNPSGCAAVDIDKSTCTPTGCCSSVDPGATVSLVVDSNPATCFANGTLTASYTYTDAQGQAQPVTVPVYFSSMNPCK